jgi:exopolyphosphatase/guanosine-5'-triphosphate,3'-diphosphate pyrophosphatase
VTDTITRVAAIDIGSNAIKIRIIEANGALRRVVGEQRWPIRLGEGTFETGALSTEAVSECLDAFHEMAQMCRGLRVDQVRAVATSATREAVNGKELVDSILAETGIQVEVISGLEEARLLAMGIRPDLNPGSHNLIIDVGGGSTEIIYTSRDGSVDTAHSMRLGAVRLAQMSRNRDGRLGRESVELLEESIESLLERSHLPVIAKDTHVVGVAGTMRALNDAIHFGEAHPVISFSARDLRQFIKKARGLDPAEMEKRFGVEQRRSAILLPGAFIVLGILDLYSIDYITVSELGLRDGLIEEMLQNSGVTTRAPENAESAALRLCEKYQSDLAHAQQVGRLAVSLFDQLESSHHLNSEWRETLRIAALCHDIGQFVGYSKHHKHGQYLVANEDFPGISPRQQGLIATLVRYHRKNTPQERHPEFAILPEEDRRALLHCAPILRLADTLDRQHHQVVTGLRVISSRTRATIEIQTRSPANLELAAAQKVSDFFTENYGLILDLQLTGND